jgi:hypothetical protein
MVLIQPQLSHCGGRLISGRELIDIFLKEDVVVRHDLISIRIRLNLGTQQNHSIYLV